jgi:hypothetical protein
MPAKILIVDSLYQTFTFEDAVAEPPVNWSERHTLPGNVTGDYLVIANAGARLDTAAADFKYNLISLVVERMLFNQNLPEPIELKDVTERVAGERQLVIYINVNGTPIVNGPNYPYWDGKPNSGTVVWLTSLDPGEDPLAPIVKTKWNGLSILNMGRKGFYGFSRKVYFGIELRSVYYSKGTLKQDFADFAALIFTKTPAQREAFFAAVEANKECVRQDPDPSKPYIAEDGRDLRTPYGDTEGANGMREKVGLVKAYFKANLGFDMPE